MSVTINNVLNQDANIPTTAECVNRRGQGNHRRRMKEGKFLRKVQKRKKTAATIGIVMNTERNVSKQHQK
jgi:hypothetical protein